MILSFRTALEAREPHAMREALHPDLVFYSPVASEPMHGREPVLALLEHVAEVMPDLHYVGEMTSEDGHALLFRATVAGQAVDGVDYCKVDDDGLVTELRVFMSPASAAQELSAAVGARLTAA